MATFSKNILSGSTNGRPILVNQTAIATGVTIHTGPTVTSSFDEIWLYAIHGFSVYLRSGLNTANINRF